MKLIRFLIALIAPHTCLGCRQEGFLLCKPCSLSLLNKLPSRCYRCHAVSRQHQTCRNCRRKTGLNHVWIAAEYEGLAKQLIHKLKFERAYAAAEDVASVIYYRTPIFPPDTVVIYIPTVSSRVRRRGYDQAELIARQIAHKKGLKHQSLLRRVSKTRQVGMSRKDRFAQLKDAFEVEQSAKLKDAQILLIDDVLTTGATIESAAKTLKQAGAKTVDVAVFAH